MEEEAILIDCLAKSGAKAASLYYQCHYVRRKDPLDEDSPVQGRPFDEIFRKIGEKDS